MYLLKKFSLKEKVPNNIREAFIFQSEDKIIGPNLFLLPGKNFIIKFIPNSFSKTDP
jgi:hypothetical protein